MKKKTKKILIMLLVCFMLGTTIAFVGCENNNNNQLENSKATIEYENGIGFSKSKTEDSYYVVKIEDKTVVEIDIPQTYNGYPVVRIEDGCFEECNNLVDLFIPISVKEIGDDIFRNCDEESHKIREIYYAGSLSEWQEIIVADEDERWIGNVNLYSDKTEINQAGKYWNYNSNGEKQQLFMPYDFWRADFYSNRKSVGSFMQSFGEDAQSFSDIFMKPDQGTYIHDVFNDLNDSTIMNELVIYFETTNFLADGQPSEEARAKGRVDLYVCALLDMLGIQENNNMEEFDIVKDKQPLTVTYETIKTLSGPINEDPSKWTKQDLMNNKFFNDLELLGFLIDECTSITKALQLYNRAMQIERYGQEVQDILIAISEEKTAPKELRDAAKLLEGYVGAGFEKLLKSTGISILNSSFTTLTNIALKFGFEMLCGSNPVLASINLAAKGFQAVNDVFGLDSQCAAYYKLRAASALEIVSINIYNKTKQTYLKEYTKESATQYISAADFFKKAQYFGSIYYSDFLQTLKENPITDLFQGEDIDAITNLWLGATELHCKNFNRFEEICLDTYNDIICNGEIEFPNDTEQNPEETPSEEKIPQGALEYNGHYYYVYNVEDIQTWEQAQQYCQTQGGYLATITNKEENDAIYTYLKNKGITNAYFGATDKESEGTWKWITGEPFIYSNWAIGEPNNEGSYEDYVMFYEKYVNGEWNDGYAVNVSTANVFICEWGELDFSNASQGLSYALSNDGTCYSVTGLGSNTATDIVIPSRHEGLPVTSIGWYAFLNCSSLTSITIPDSVTSIGNGAFNDCDSLTSITIPDSVTSIGSFAFYGCDSLTNVTIGNVVTIIGSSAFSNCNSLTSIIVDENNTDYKSIDGNLYSKDGKTLIQYAIGKTATSFTIPNGVITVGEYAFSWCTNLTNVIISNSVVYIEEYAFNCCSLNTVTIPNSVENIGTCAFNMCNLETIEIPNSVVNIGIRAFSINQRLQSINVAEANLNYKSINGSLYSKDGKTLMQYAIGKTEDVFTICDFVTNVDEYAFGFSCLKSIIIPNSVTSIGDGAFEACNSLQTIYCEVESQPSDWVNSWKYGCDAQVVWGYTGN